MLARYKYFFLSIILIISLLSNPLFAQQFNFKNFGAKSGLTSSTITVIFQDRDGFVWMGTQGAGVTRFDGKQFKSYNKKNGLIAKDITSLNQDKLGNIWISSPDGVSKFDGVSFTNYTEKEGLANNLVYSIYCDEQNNIWFATSGGGVSIFSNGKFVKTMNQSSGLSSDVVFAIVQDKQNNYWFALDNGIAKYDGKTITNYNTNPLINKKAFFSAVCDSNGNLWFGSVNTGVIKYDGKQFYDIKLPAEVASDFIGSIVEDSHKNIWFATDHGVLKYDGLDYSIFNEKNGLSSNAILGLTVDYESNLWVGTNLGGVNLLGSEAIVKYANRKQIIESKVNCIFEYADNAYLVGTLSSGLSLFSENTFTQIPFLKDENISSITRLKDNTLWVATGGGSGIMVLTQNGNNFTLKEHIKQLNKVTLPLVANIIQDKSETIWVATYGEGLFKIKGNDIAQFSSKNGLPSDNILSMFVDSKSNIWLGTNDAGIIKIAPNGLITNYTEKDGLPSKSVWAITEDDKHNLYFGTNDAGIISYNGKEFKALDTKDGLCSNNVQALVWDKNYKNLIAGTDKGINKLYVNASCTIDSLRYYGEHEGFKGGEVNQGAILVDTKGLVWFGLEQPMVCLGIIPNTITIQK